MSGHRERPVSRVLAGEDPGPDRSSSSGATVLFSGQNGGKLDYRAAGEDRMADTDRSREAC